ncbi:MAG: hypothetical protein AAGC53_07555 [Actinomycetota bacterium]
MDDLLASILSDALAQADGLLELGAVRAEVWASDLMALAAEAGPDGPTAVIEGLSQAGGAGPAAALWAIDAVADGVDLSDPALEPAPTWAGDLLTSTCEASWLVSDWRGGSAAFRFVDATDERHVVLVDLVPGGAGGPETVGEATAGPAELLDAVADADAKLRSDAVPPFDLAARVAAAVRATAEPSASLVAMGRLLVARLSTLGIEDLVPPVWVEPAIPELPPRDPGDDAWAADVVRRALGENDSLEAHESALREAGAVLRAAAAKDEPIAQWLAASVGPVDLDESDADVVLAALAAAVAPATVVPLAADARNAVLELEFADWLGAVLGLVRSGPGTSVDPLALIDHVNRCPEVTTDIPKADRARLAWAFGVATEAWEPLGLTDGATLTGFGHAALPAVLLRAWAPRPDLTDE